MSDEKKEFLTVTLPILLAIVGGIYIFKTDIYRLEDKIEKSIERSDNRWYDLLKEMHRIDKNIQKVEIESSSDEVRD